MDNNDNKLFFELPKNRPSAIKVIGVGGGGNNAVRYMHNQGISGVDFIICNTDAQALINSPIPIKIQLGTTITEGLGAGANPEVGEQAAIESIDEIKNSLGENTKMVFITAGMGGGTGTGAAPIIAGLAKEMGILTVGIVTIPFSFEGKSRLEQAEKGLEKFRKSVDSLIVINNDKLRELFGNLGYKSGFSKADEILSTAAKGIAEVITQNYTINIDLRDAKTVLSDSGTAIMGSAKASGVNKAQDAIVSALDSPLLNDNKITGAKNVLLLIVSGSDEITIDEIGVINDYIQNEAGNNTNIIMGIGEDENLGEEISVTVIATGFPLDDVRNSGKEREKIYHTLNDDLFKETPTSSNIKGINQSSVSQQNTLSEEEPFIIKKNKDAFSVDDSKPHQEQKTTFLLEEEEEVTHFGISTQKEMEIPKEDLFSNDFTVYTKKETPEEKPVIQNLFFTEEKQEKETPEEKPSQTNVFTLDEADNFTQKISEEKEQFEQKISQEQFIHKAKPIIIESPISEEKKVEIKAEAEENSELNELMQRKIQERRNRLKQLNSKYQSLSKQNVDEIEKIPAYKRQGLDLDDNSTYNKSEDTFFDSKSNQVKLRPNNFFHDNVD